MSEVDATDRLTSCYRQRRGQKRARKQPEMRNHRHIDIEQQDRHVWSGA